MRILLLGYGEIGKGVYEMLISKYAVDIYDPGKGLTHIDYHRLETVTTVLCVAIPWSDEFIPTVTKWQAEIPGLKSTIIFSTVPIGTCRQVKAVHYPIEAKHPFIYRDIKINRKGFMGGHDVHATGVLNSAGFKFTVLQEPEHTEFLKLRSTAIYGVNIEFARYTADVCKAIGLNYSVIKEYDENHNRLCKERGTPEHARYILDAPEGPIGGHCVVPNAHILEGQFPHLLLELIIANSPDPEDEK